MPSLKSRSFPSIWDLSIVRKYTDVQPTCQTPQYLEKLLYLSIIYHIDLPAVLSNRWSARQSHGPGPWFVQVVIMLNGTPLGIPIEKFNLPLRPSNRLWFELGFTMMTILGLATFASKKRVQFLVWHGGYFKRDVFPFNSRCWNAERQVGVGLSTSSEVSICRVLHYFPSRMKLLDIERSRRPWSSLELGKW